jgi:signal transduction histidine kinase
MLSSALFAATRRRLVLWNISVAGVIIAAFALVAYFTAAHVLSGEIDYQLAARAAQEQSHASLDLLSGPDNDRDYDAETSGVFFLLLSPDGTVLHSSLDEQLPGLPNMEAVHAALANSYPDLRTVDVGVDGEVELRLRTEPVIRDGVLLGVLQLGISVQPYEHELHQLLLVLAFVGAGGLVLALVGGFFLASRALIPVRAAFVRQRDFVADASHELRTPLMLIRANVDVLGRELRAMRASLPAIKAASPPSGKRLTSGGSAVAASASKPGVFAAEQLEDQLELVDDALVEIDRMTRLLSDMLLLARLDAGAVMAPHQPVALDVLLEEVTHQIRRRVEAEGLRIQVRLEPGVQVLGNIDQLRRLWLILLDNAIRYNRPAGSITVRSTVEGHQAWVLVADAGIGIAPAHLSHLFERFYRADTTRSRTPAPGMPTSEVHQDSDHIDIREQAGTGAGLGLALAREIVQAHGGHISVKSMPGEGSTFTVRLPLAERQVLSHTGQA